MIDSGTLYFLTGKMIVGTLLFIRVMGMVMAGPFFGSTPIPTQVKIFLSLLISIALTSAFGGTQPTIDFHLWN